MDIRNFFETKIVAVEKVVDGYPWADKEAYALFLAQTYFYVKHSTALLGRAVRKLDDRYADLKKRFVEHSKEEAGHHRLALTDLKHLGYTIGDFNEFTETQIFYGNQYSLIEKSGGTSLFGYILQLEGLAVRKGSMICSAAKAAYGDTCANFMRVHAAEDVEHVEHAFHFISKLSQPEYKVVEENFLGSCALYSAILDRAVTETGKARKILAAA